MERDAQEYAVPYVSQSRLRGGTRGNVPADSQLSPPRTAWSSLIALGAGGAIGLPMAQMPAGISAVSPPHPGGYRPNIWWDRPFVTRARPAERTCTATQRPGDHRTVHLHKKLSTYYTPLYFLLSSAVSRLWSPTTSSSPLTAHLLRSCFFLPTSPST